MVTWGGNQCIVNSKWSRSILYSSQELKKIKRASGRRRQALLPFEYVILWQRPSCQGSRWNQVYWFVTFFNNLEKKHFVKDMIGMDYMSPLRSVLSPFQGFWQHCGGGAIWWPNLKHPSYQTKDNVDWNNCWHECRQIYYQTIRKSSYENMVTCIYFAHMETWADAMHWLLLSFYLSDFMISIKGGKYAWISQRFQ